MSVVGFQDPETWVDATGLGPRRVITMMSRIRVFSRSDAARAS
jgi:hypothetical protein